MCWVVDFTGCVQWQLDKIEQYNTPFLLDNSKSLLEKVFYYFEIDVQSQCIWIKLKSSFW